MYQSFLIHSSADGHLGCFHVLAIVNSAAMNIGVPVSFSILVFSGFLPSSGLGGSYGSFIPSFLRNLRAVFQYVFFFFCLTSFYITTSRFIYITRTGSNSFFFMAEWYFTVYMHHNFFIHSSVDGHLGCFYVLIIVNSTAMNAGLYASFWIVVFSGYVPGRGIAGSYSSFTPSFFFKESPYCSPYAMLSHFSRFRLCVTP